MKSRQLATSTHLQRSSKKLRFIISVSIRWTAASAMDFLIEVFVLVWVAIYTVLVRIMIGK